MVWLLGVHGVLISLSVKGMLQIDNAASAALKKRKKEEKREKKEALQTSGSEIFERMDGGTGPQNCWSGKYRMIINCVSRNFVLYRSVR